MAVFVLIASFFSIILLLPLAYVAFYMFDQLVRSEYISHRKAWERDGRPWGWSWRPPGQGRASEPKVWPYPPPWRWDDQNWRSLEAKRRCALLWLFRTPAWMRQNRTLLRLVLWYRTTTLAFMLAPASYVAIFFYVVIATIVSGLF